MNRSLRNYYLNPNLVLTAKDANLDPGRVTEAAIETSSVDVQVIGLVASIPGNQSANSENTLVASSIA